MNIHTDALAAHLAATAPTPAHVFDASGCRYQWRGDHDHAACWEAFEAR